MARKLYESRGRKFPYFPTFYGKMKGLYMKDRTGSAKPYLSYDMTSKFTHQSLVTLEFVADSVSFIESRYKITSFFKITYWQSIIVCRTYGRIVETLMEDITVLNGGGLLTVTVQNTGYITGDFSVLKYNLIHCLSNSVLLRWEWKTAAKELCVWPNRLRVWTLGSRACLSG